MKLQGVFGVPAINKETGKEYIQPIPNVIVVLRTDKGVEYTFEVDSFGAYTTDIPIGEYGVQAYVKGNKQTLGYLRQGVHFPVTEATTVGDFDTWLKIDTVNNPDPLLSQWTQLLKDIEKQRTEFANDIKDVVGVIERESEPVIQNAIDRVQKEANAVRVEVETIVTNTQENLDAYLVTKKTQYDKDLAANVATSNAHLLEVTVIKTDIENLQKVFDTSKDKAIADLSSEYAKHSKALTTETTTHKHTLTAHTGVLKTELTEHSDILKQSAVEEVGASIAVNTGISNTIQRYLEEGQALNTTITQSGETAVSNIKAQETSSLKSITNKESNTLSNIVSTTDSSIVSIRDAESLAINNFKSEALLESDTLLVKYKGDLQGEGDRVLGTISPTIEAELQEATLSLSQTLITSKAELGSKKDEHLVTIKTAEESAIETIQSYVESSEFASIAYVDEQISTIPKVDLSGYLTKPNAESTYAKKTDLSKKADKSDITGLHSSIDKKVDTTVFNEEVVKKLEQKDLAGYSTENYVDQKFNSIDINKYATKTELATKWDIQPTIGDVDGKVMREGAYGIGALFNRYGYRIDSLDNYLDMQSGIVNGMAEGGFNAYHPFLLARRYGSNLTAIGANTTTINFAAYSSASKKWTQGFAHTNLNTRTDKNNVLHSGGGTPINTLNVSDMADTVVDNDEITVTSGAVHRALKALESLYVLKSDIVSVFGTSKELAASQDLANQTKAIADSLEADILRLQNKISELENS